MAWVTQVSKDPGKQFHPNHRKEKDKTLSWFVYNHRLWYCSRPQQ